MAAATTIETTDVVTAEVVKSDALAPAFAGLEASSARQLREAFVPALLQIEEWERQAADLTVTDESQTAKMELAGVMRKALKKVRVSVEKKRKEMNADALARTKAINCAAGIVEGLIVPLETRLLEQETFGERAAQARQDALSESRYETLRALGADPAAYRTLGGMNDDTWANALEAATAARDAKVEAAKQAEAIRIEAERLAAEARAAEKAAAVKAEAERLERERLQKEENDRLKREAAEREAEAAREIAAVKAEAEAEAARVHAVHEAERAAAEREARRKHEEDTAARKVASDAEAVRQAELRKAQEEAAKAKAEAERVTAERAEADAARVAAEAAALLAPDREKLIAFAATLRALAIPSLTTAQGQTAAKKVASQIEKMAAWVSATGEAL